MRLIFCMFAQQCILGTLDKFETSLFTLNKKCFLFTLRIKQSLMILSFCLRKARAAKSRDLSLSHNFRKYVFRPRQNTNTAFSNCSGLKSVYVKLRFCDGLVWKPGLTVEIKLGFRTFPAFMWTQPEGTEHGRFVLSIFNARILVVLFSVSEQINW